MRGMGEIVEAMDSLPSEFLTEIREAAGSAVWSQAVENSRRDLVSVDRQLAGEFGLLKTPGR